MINYLGVVVGRFQVPWLHAGHKHLFQEVFKDHTHVLVLIGVTEAILHRRNPLPFEARKEMLETAFSQMVDPLKYTIEIKPIYDRADDEVWNHELDTLIKENSTDVAGAILYGSRDSFLATYKGEYSHVLVPEKLGEANKGVEMRRTFEKKRFNKAVFRAGMIHAAYLYYPTVFPTVDVAVFKKERGENSLLLGKKKDGKFWRFPGGFVDPKDLNYAAAAQREVLEETNIKCNGFDLLGTYKVDDYRYRKSEHAIMTNFFTALFISGTPKPMDDLARVQWINVRGMRAEQFMPVHRPLFEKLRFTHIYNDYTTEEKTQSPTLFKCFSCDNTVSILYGARAICGVCNKPMEKICE